MEEQSMFPLTNLSCLLQMEVTLNDNHTEMIILVNGTNVDLETLRTGELLRFSKFNPKCRYYKRNISN